MRIDATELKRLREERKLTQKELAQAAGLTESTIYRYETARRGAEPSAAAVHGLAEALKVEPGDLLTEAPLPAPAT